jgi:hypothetical protein
MTNEASKSPDASPATMAMQGFKWLGMVTTE